MHMHIQYQLKVWSKCNLRPLNKQNIAISTVQHGNLLRIKYMQVCHIYIYRAAAINMVDCVLMRARAFALAFSCVRIWIEAEKKMNRCPFGSVAVQLRNRLLKTIISFNEPFIKSDSHWLWHRFNLSWSRSFVYRYTVCVHTNFFRVKITWITL